MKYDFTQNEYNDVICNFKFDMRKREKEIFEMQSAGIKNKEIAEKLGVSVMTIHRKQKVLMKKIKFFLQEKENLKETYCVYAHIFPNNKKYIGITSDTKRRWNNGYGYKENEKMFNDILMYGWNNIEHKIIADNLTYNQAIEIEKENIQKYMTYEEKNGYNIKY